MTEQSSQSREIEKLQQAIAALEAQRSLLGDAVVETATAGLRKDLAALLESSVVEQQRKLVTILVMDIVDSTVLTRDLDPEDTLAIMDAALAQLSQPVVACGGHITRFSGDGFLSVFGYDTAQENDAEMAVQAGLGILAAATSFTHTEDAPRHVADFNVRVGISTGPVVIGGQSEGDDTLAGNAVILATRLESAAPPGGLIISQQTYLHVRGLFDLQPIGPVDAKGFAEPVEAYLVKRAKPRSFRTTNRGVEGIETHMIGRESELEALKTAFSHVVTGNECRLVTVVGDAGIGKSRLLYEFEAWLDVQSIDVWLYKGRARLQTKGLPYGLLRDLIGYRFQILVDDPAAIVRRKLVANIRAALADENAEMKAHFIGELLGHDFHDSPHLKGVLDNPQELHDRALIYLADYFRAIAYRDPVVVFLEDLHWADESSLDILSHLFRDLSDQRLFIIALTRPVLFENRSQWAGDLPFNQWLTLQPLSQGDSRRLVTELLQKAASIPDELCDLIVNHADGNPYYLEELIKMFVEDGVIVKGESSWQVHLERLNETRVPPTLAEVLQARLESLPGTERMVLQQASVVGRIFWDKVINYIASDRSLERLYGDLASDITTALQNLCNRELVFRREESAFTDAAEHIFKHAIMRDVTYESVLKRVRRDYHARVADWLISNGGDRSGEITGLIADHLEHAGKKSKALHYLRRAGADAAAQFANEEALSYFGRALALAEEGDLLTRYELLIEREEILDRRGHRELQKADLMELTVIADQLGQVEKQANTALQWAEFYLKISDYAAAISSAEHTVALAQQAGDILLEAGGLLVMGKTLWHQGQYKSAQQRLEQVLVLARAVNDAKLQGLALLNLGNTIADQGDNQTARDYYEMALAINQNIGNRINESVAINNLGIMAADMGDFETARHYFERSLAIARQTGYRRGEGLALGNLGNVTADLGDFVASKAYFEDYLNNARKIANRQGEAYAYSGLGYASHRLGADAEAASYYQAAEDLRETLGQKHLAIESRAGWAQALLAMDKRERSLELVEPILEFLQQHSFFDWTDSAEIYLTCVEVLQANNDPRAKEYLHAAYTLLQERASQFKDEEARRVYLEDIPRNRVLIELYEADQN